MRYILYTLVLTIAFSAVYGQDYQKVMTQKAVLKLLQVDMANKIFRHGLDGDKLVEEHIATIEKAFQDNNLKNLQLVMYREDYTIPVRIYEYQFGYGTFCVEGNKVDTPEMKQADDLIKSLPKLYNVKCLVVYCVPASCLRMYGLIPLEKDIQTWHLNNSKFSAITSPWNKVDLTIHYTVERVEN